MSKCTQASAAPYEITRGSQQHYRAMFKVNKGDILATVKLSSCDLAVLELWGLQSKYDNRVEKHKINTLLHKCTYFGVSYESHHCQIYCRDIHVHTHRHTDTDSLNIIFQFSGIINSQSLPSLTMPTLRHFWNRQYWHLLRRLLSTGQFLFARQTYFAFF